VDLRWRIELLGGLRAARGDRVITHFRTRKTAELFAYLAYHPQRPHPRELLIELLWPECELEAGRHNLSMALSWMRQQLEPPGVGDGSVLAADRYCAGLNPASITTDVAEFEAALRSAAHAEEPAARTGFLTAAVELYRGDLLPGFYEDWVGPEQQRLDELFFHALRQLIAQLEQTGEMDHALQYALRAVGANRLREEAHREVIRLYAALGQPDAALRQFRELGRILQQELDATPSAATQGLVREIRSGRGGSVGVWEYACMGVSGSEPQAAPVAQAAGTRLTAEPTPTHPRAHTHILPMEPVGGAVPLDSRFYVSRQTDGEFRSAIARRDSIVLVKGARQAGKSSLLARGLQQAREQGAAVALTHFDIFNAAHLEAADPLLLAVAETLAEQLDLDALPVEGWDVRRGANLNFRRYIRREVLGKLSTPLVWGLDGVDRLFACSFGSEIFALFRAWHDERALEPDGPWAGLTLAIAYSTDAQLFITDINQSPFNVGTRLTLEDFSPEQMADLNRRYGSPLKSDAELSRYYRLVEGHPYLVRRGMHEMSARGIRIDAFEERAARDDWIFGEHLRRIVALLSRNPELREATRQVLGGQPCPTRESFYRLRSAGVLAGDTPSDARPRCLLYSAYLEQHLL
jgi:DNA-binding SARP family transcriptional activator